MAFDAQVTGTPVAGKELPKWIAADGALKGPMSPKEQLDRRASPLIAQSLPTDQPARIKLLELVTSRPQWEVKWLSLRCLAYVGQFHDMLVALNDVAQKPHWLDYIDALRVGGRSRFGDGRGGPHGTGKAVSATGRRTVPHALALHRQATGIGDNGKGAKTPNWSTAWTTTCWPSGCWATPISGRSPARERSIVPRIPLPAGNRRFALGGKRLDAKEIRLVKRSGRPAARSVKRSPRRFPAAESSDFDCSR